MISINVQPQSCAAAAHELVQQILQQPAVQHVHVLGAMPMPSQREGQILDITLPCERDADGATLLSCELLAVMLLLMAAECLCSVSSGDLYAQCTLSCGP